MKKVSTLIFFISFLFLLQPIFCMKEWYVTNFINELNRQTTKNIEIFTSELTRGLVIDNGQNLLWNANFFLGIKQMKLLLQFGIDPNYEQNHESILHRASNTREADIKKIKLLLEHGANPTLKGNQGSDLVHFVRSPANVYGIHQTGIHGIITDLLETAQKIWLLIRENNIKEAINCFIKQYPDELELFYNILFALQSKKQFEKFEQVVQEKINATFKINCKISLNEFIYETIASQLLHHFLERGIFEWHDTMYSKFLNLQQKKDVTRYKYNDTSISKISYDMCIRYYYLYSNNTYKAIRFF